MSRFPDVMLLAAGLGTRLRPLTLDAPKPLVKVVGSALLDRVIAAARAEGAQKFVVNVHSHPDQMLAHVNFMRAQGLDIQASDERERLLDTGGGVKKALPLFGSDPIVVMNTDAFWLPGADRPLARMLQRPAREGSIVLLCAQPHRARGFRRSHDFCLDPGGRITTDSGAPVIYAGVALIPRRLLEAQTEARFSLNRLFDVALERGTLQGVVLDAEWLHVGDPEGLAEAEAALRETAR